MIKHTFTTLLFTLLSSLLFAEAERPLIAVVDFDVASQVHRPIAEHVGQVMSDELVNTGLFDTVEREKLQTIMQEQGFAGSGLVEPHTAIEMGRMLGVRYLLTGTVLSADREVRNFSGYGTRTQTSFFTVRLRAQILEAETGRILFSTTEKAEETQSQAGGLKISDSGIFNRLAEEAAGLIVNKIVASNRFKPEEPNEVTYVGVTILSTPENADVEVGGIFYGNAGPDEIELPGGLQSVKISLPGYDVWEKKVMLRAGQTLRATLSKSNQADLKVEIENK